MAGFTEIFPVRILLSYRAAVISIYCTFDSSYYSLLEKEEDTHHSRRRSYRFLRTFTFQALREMQRVWQVGLSAFSV